MGVTMYDPNNGTLSLYWDANGNLAQMIGCKQHSGRLHEWDVKRNSRTEKSPVDSSRSKYGARVCQSKHRTQLDRLRFVLGEKFAGYYGYDANGERVYKLTGISNLGQVNSGSIKAQAIFDDAILYPNPYMVVTQKGYTKHYYAGTERLATVIGGARLGKGLNGRDDPNLIVLYRIVFAFKPIMMRVRHVQKSDMRTCVCHFFVVPLHRILKKDNVFRSKHIHTRGLKTKLSRD